MFRAWILAGENIDHFARGPALLQQADSVYADIWVELRLGRDRADSRLRMGEQLADRGHGRGSPDPDLAASAASGDDGEGHEAHPLPFRLNRPVFRRFLASVSFSTPHLASGSGT